MIRSSKSLARKLALTSNSEIRNSLVFNAIQLMTPPPPKPKQIGFRPKALKK